MLEGKGITKRFGGLVALSNLELEVEKGAIVGLIDLMDPERRRFSILISGFLRPEEGRVCFDGSEITRLRPYQIGRLRNRPDLSDCQTRLER